MNNYIKRLVDDEIQKNLKVFGGVLVEGMKYCGKSTTCKNLAKTIIEFQDPKMGRTYASLVKTDPNYYFSKEKPILFDEWQEVPEVWDMVRSDVDKTSSKGAYLLTGSSAPKEGATMHSGIGRINKIKMSTMTLFETGESTGEVSLKELFDGTLPVRGESNVGIQKLAEIIVRGGFPDSLDYTEEEAVMANKGYIKLLVNEDVRKLDGVRRDPDKMQTLLKSYARNISTTASDATIKKDMEAEGISIDDKTFLDYVNTLQKLFIVDNVKAWNPKLRSKTAIRTADKKELADTGIASAALGVTSKKLINDINTFGFFFEALCMHNLRIYAGSIDGTIYHYRDKTDLEVDAIINLDDDRWAAIEIKLGVDEIDEAAENLIKFKNKIDTDKKGEPAFLMILYGGRIAYKREDGVLVVPITCLKN